MNLEKEAGLFARHFMSAAVSGREVAIYESAIKTGAFDLTPHETWLLALMVSFPVLCSIYDYTFGFLRIQSGIQKRMFLMLSILETSPAFSDRFLMRPRNCTLAMIRLFGRLIKGGVYCLIGCLTFPLLHLIYYGYTIRLYGRRVRQ